MQEADHHLMLEKTTQQPGTDISTSDAAKVQCEKKKEYLRCGIDPVGAAQVDDGVAKRDNAVTMISQFGDERRDLLWKNIDDTSS